MKSIKIKRSRNVRIIKHYVNTTRLFTNYSLKTKAKNRIYKFNKSYNYSSHHNYLCNILHKYTHPTSIKKECAIKRVSSTQARRLLHTNVEDEPHLCGGNRTQVWNKSHTKTAKIHCFYHAVLSLFWAIFSVNISILL